MTTLKPFDSMDYNKLWKILKRDRNTRLLDLLSEKCVCRSRSNSKNWTWTNTLVQNSERSTSGCILSPCLLNLYAEYIMQNSSLDESQAGIKIARRNINNLRHADDIILMVESQENERVS